MWLLLGIAAAALVACALRARAAGGPSAIPTGLGFVPPGSGIPTAAGDAAPAVGALAVALNQALHTVGSSAAASLLSQFQSAASLPTSGVYDDATARALAAYVTSPPAPDVSTS